MLCSFFFVRCRLFSVNIEVEMRRKRTSSNMMYCTGFPFSFGIFQQYYASHEFSSDPSGIAVIGTTATVRHPMRFTSFPKYLVLTIPRA